MCGVRLRASHTAATLHLMSARRRVIRYLAIAFCAVVVLGLAYQLIGGATRIVVSSGASMEPGISSGDLILVHRQADYEVGDVVAYRSADLGTVLHRIVDSRVEADGTHFVMKGDNNTFVDADEPTESAVLGRSIAVVPGGGRILSLLPILAAAGFAAYWVYTRSPGSPGPAFSATGRTNDRSFTARQISGIAVVTVFGLVTIFAASSPTSNSMQRDVRHESGIDVGWTAEPEPSVLYPDGFLRQNDPVFMNEISEVEIWADLAAITGGTNVNGTMSLTALVGDGSGWHQRINLGDPVAITNGQAQSRGILDLQALRALVGQVSSRSGYTPSDYSITIEVSGLVIGSFDGVDIDEEVHHQVPLIMDDLLLRPTAEAEWSAEIVGFVTVEDEAATTLGIGSAALPVALVRVLAPVAVIGGLLLIFWLSPARDPHDHINEYFSGFVMNVTNAALPTHEPMMTVESYEDLLRMAQVQGSPILHIEAADSHQWATLAMGIWYRYQLLNAVAAAQVPDSISAATA